MPSIDPKWQFALQVLVFIAVGVSQGAVHLTNLIPGGWIPAATAWFGLIAFVGTGFTAIGGGIGMTNSSRAAAAAALPASDKIALAASLPADAKVALAASTPEVQQIVTTRAIAQAAGPDGDGAKVVSKS